MSEGIPGKPNRQEAAGDAEASLEHNAEKFLTEAIESASSLGALYTIVRGQATEEQRLNTAAGRPIFNTFTKLQGQLERLPEYIQTNKQKDLVKIQRVARMLPDNSPIDLFTKKFGVAYKLKALLEAQLPPDMRDEAPTYPSDQLDIELP